MGDGHGTRVCGRGSREYGRRHGCVDAGHGSRVCGAGTRVRCVGAGAYDAGVGARSWIAGDVCPYARPRAREKERGAGGLEPAALRMIILSPGLPTHYKNLGIMYPNPCVFKRF